MPTQYTTILKLALPVQGELVNTWGDTVNDEITSMVEQAIAGRVVINTWVTNSHTLTVVNGAMSESRAAILKLTDTEVALSGAGAVICPDASKVYIVENSTLQTITVKTAGGTGIVIDAGVTKTVFCDGTNVLDPIGYNNGVSGLAAESVQAAIDEVEARVQINEAAIAGLGTASLADTGVAASTDLPTRADADARYLSLSGGTLTGDLTIPDKLVHAGDTNNYIQFGTDAFKIINGGSTILETNTTDINVRRTLDIDPLVNTSAINALVHVDAAGNDASHSGILLDMNISGDTPATANRLHRGLNIDLDSSYTGGDTSNEGRLYGAYVVATSSGDNDLVYGGRFQGQTSGTASGAVTQTTQVIGVEGYAGQNRSMLSANIYGVKGMSVADNAGATGTVNVNDAFGVYGKHNQSTGGTSGTTSHAHGIYGEVESNEGVVTSAYAVRAVIDSNSGAIGTGYLFHGAYAGTIGTKWGLHLTGATKNKITGQIQSDNGTVELPIYSFSNEVNTGMYRITTDAIGFATNAGLRLRVDNAGIDVTGAITEDGTLLTSKYLGISASAANSNLLDGIDSSRFIYGANGTGTTAANPTVTTAPWQKSGFYDINGSGNNAPTNTYYSYINMRHNNTGNNYGHQIAGSFYSQGDLYNRQITDNNYGSWSKIWNTTNDGAGSGLDADLLDGSNAAVGATANTIALRDAAGDIHTRYLQSSYVNMSHGVSGATNNTVFYSSYDNYIRKNNATGFRASLSVYSKAEIDALNAPLSNYNLDGLAETSDTLGARSYHLQGSGLPNGNGTMFSQAYNSVYKTHLYHSWGNRLYARTQSNNETNNSAWAELYTTLSKPSAADIGAATTAQGTLASNSIQNNSTVYNKLVTTSGALIQSTSSDTTTGLSIGQGTPGADAFITFHISGDYAANFGIDGSTNKLSYGGWSSGGTSYAIYHEGNDGSGSGLDADLLDGLQGSRYVANQDGSRYTTDFNTILTSGFYNAQVTPANAPGNYGQLIVAKGVDTGMQIYGGYNNDNLWFRGWGSSGATLYPWRKVWHDANDGSGSGLDADLLDGQQGSYYAPASHNHSGVYLPIGGKAADSNLLDGIDSSRVIYGTDTSKVTRYDGDWNGMFATVNTGFFDNASGTNGNPDGFTHHHGFQVRHNNSSSSWGYQFMGSYHPSYPSLYHRSVNGGTWSGWKKLWDSNNDGSGSGLDADTVDGIQGASFLRSDANDSIGGKLTMSTQKALVAGNYGHGVFGLYSATRYQHVWSMGTSYKTNTTGTSYGNMYGLTWTHTNIGTAANQSIAGLSHQLQLRMNGTLKTVLGHGIWTAGNITAYSDIAVKTNLVRIPNALEKVCSINGYTYERTDYVKDKEDANAPDILRQAGVVAQEVEKVLPEVVSGEDGNKAVAYGNMVALLIESIKELKGEVDELKSQLKNR